MKKCPNCGASMDADVKFCTNCGTKLSSANTKINVNNNLKRSGEEKSTSQSITQAARMKRDNSQTPRQSSVVMNNYWQWLVNSWKQPTGEFSAEKWYGVATILGEILLFVWGISIAINGSITQMFGSTGGGFTTQVLFELFLFLALVGLGKVVGVIVGRKFAFQEKVDFLTVVNRVAHISNINAIIMVVAFICCILGGNNYGFAVLLSIIALLIFDLACIMITVKGQKAKHDIFYGLLISVAIAFVIMMILLGVFGNTLKDQIQSLLSSIFKF